MVGFYLDHTLCRYNLPESAPLIYNSFAQFLVKEKGYDKELLNVTPEDWNFCCKRLALDLEDGTSLNLLVMALFSGQAMYYFYNYFDLPGALLCARVVDYLTTNNGQKTFDFWKDIVAAIQHNYKMSAFKENCGIYFPKVKIDPGRYLHSCPESVKKWLRQLKNAGKNLLLITSYHSDYCRLLYEYILDFADFFDMVITNALKPGFFSHLLSQRPFRMLENDEEQEALPSLDKPGWCSQGNAVHLYELLKKITGKPEPKVVCFGDSMHSDIFWLVTIVIGRQASREKGKYEGPKAKPLNASSKKWGSFYFISSVLGLENTEDSLVYTWSCKRISTYSTIAIPSIEVITELPLDYKFTRFSSSNSKTAGYYSNPPLVLSNDGTLITK
uniref:5'-nucleotidase domain-containing protein 1 n=1 Tax=Colobus angolensis palliatus TaxID=336983 RepID=A0A2K5JDR7_COLAP